MHALATALLLAGCARTPSTLDQISFVGGCWREDTTTGDTYRLCWSRAGHSWIGTIAHGTRNQQYEITERGPRLVLVYRTSDGAIREIVASRIERRRVTFLDRQPRIRGPDLDLWYREDSDRLWVLIFDVSHSFGRDH